MLTRLPNSSIIVFIPSGMPCSFIESEGKPIDWKTHQQEVLACRKCPRLVAWREQVARENGLPFAIGIIGQAGCRGLEMHKPALW
jgi:hypothetical protein